MKLDRITVDPNICFGKPCIRGLRIPVHLIVDLVAAGKSPAEILGEYPELEAKDIRQALEYAAGLSRATEFGISSEGRVRGMCGHSSQPCRHFLVSAEADIDTMAGTREVTRLSETFSCGKTRKITGPDGRGCNKPGTHSMVPACERGRVCFEPQE